MKRRFAVLTVLGALVALAVPASSMAGMSPAGHKFEIAGGTTAPQLTNSLGSCTISKINATIPTAPTNEVAGEWPATVTAGTCTSGASITLASNWAIKTYTSTGSFLLVLNKGPEAIVMRFSSLPGCKLVTPAGFNFSGVWSNGTTNPTLLKSQFYTVPHSINLSWKNDGGSCALAGKTESTAYEPYSPIPGAEPIFASTVTDLTSPTTPVILNNDK
jgi:hypothetical protein